MQSNIEQTNSLQAIFLNINNQVDWKIKKVSVMFIHL